MRRIQRQLGVIAANAESLMSFRQQALVLVREVVPYDAAMLHAFSPRVPLSTAALVGLDGRAVARSQKGWDDVAVELGALREAANERLAVSSTEVFAPGSKGSERVRRMLWRWQRLRSLCMVHLVVRGYVRAGMMLLSRKVNGFSPRQVAMLRQLAPTLAVGDALHEQLDGAPRAPSALRLVCRDERLTPRQRQLVEHVAMGHTNREIGAALGLSPNTVRNHLARVFERVGAANRADLIRLAVLGPSLASSAPLLA